MRKLNLQKHDWRIGDYVPVNYLANAQIIVITRVDKHTMHDI
jgi:hypothetical protein